MSKYKPLTYDERKIIEKMCKFGASGQEIADAIDKTYSTIYRELRRCSLGKYSACLLYTSELPTNRSTLQKKLKRTQRIKKETGMATVSILQENGLLMKIEYKLNT